MGLPRQRNDPTNSSHITPKRDAPNASRFLIVVGGLDAGAQAKLRATHPGMALV